MDNRKRSRLEVVAASTARNKQTNTLATPLSSLTSQSFFLSSGINDIGTSTNNVLLTICGDQSDESQEFLCLDESLAHIKKEEENIGGLEYSIVNPLRTSIDGDVATANSRLNTMLPTTVQLPSGCDIYLVKDYVEQESTTFPAAGSSAGFKLETCAHFTSADAGAKQFVRCNAPQLMTKPADTAHTSGSGNAVYGTDTNNKHSYILETYKKRDDKRRATHNEVERRRRDKINSWIFKLKEMLPDMSSNQTNTCHSNNNALVATVTSPTTTTAAHERSNGHYSRTPPNDSKSQILIKACEYIRTMQEELKSLRECLSENENLRVSNQRLQTELDKLKQNGTDQNLIQNRHHNQNVSHGDSSIISSNNNNDSLNVTLNTLNSNSFKFPASSPAPTAAAYTKRELIIRDYVD